MITDLIISHLKSFANAHLTFINIHKKLYRDYKKYHKKCTSKNHIASKWLREKQKDYYTHKLYKKYHCFISLRAQINENTTFPHPIGIIIGDGAKIGKNCTIYQNVTIGRRNPKNPEDIAIIGDNVLIGCNSIILGNIHIGNNAKIAAGSIVLRDVKPNETVHGVVK